MTILSTAAHVIGPIAATAAVQRAPRPARFKIDRQPQPVEPDQQPRLGTHQTGHPEQHEDRQPAPFSLRLKRRRPDNHRQVRDVDVAARGEEAEVQARAHQCRGDDADDRREACGGKPVHAGGQRHERRQRRRDHQPVAGAPEQRHPGAEQDRERMLGRRPVGLKRRQMPVQQLAAPQQRVEAVVGRVRRIDEESD